MKILSVWSQKGGVGKTVLAINIAAGLTKRGYAVQVVDLDPQACYGSSSTVAALDADKKLEFAVTCGYPKKRPEVDFLVFDHPSGTNFIPDNSSNLVIMPFQPCVLDFRAWKDSLRLLPKGVKKIPVVNRCNRVRREDQQVVDEMLRQAKIAKKPVVIINDRAIFKRQIGEGQSIFTAGNRYGGSEAIKEMNDLLNGIFINLEMEGK